jgi:5-methylcytosine-specific restriction enzyme B
MTDIPEPRALAAPFAELFASIDDAQWAFELLRAYLARLDVTSADNPRASVTLRRIGRKVQIRANFCGFAVASVRGEHGRLTHAQLLLSEGAYDPGQTIHLSPMVDGQQCHLYSMPVDALRSPRPELILAVAATTDLLLAHFRGAHATPWRDNQNITVARAVYEPSLLPDLLAHGASFNTANSDALAGGIRYWKIAPGDGAWQWAECRDGDFIALGWDEMGDLTGMTREQFDERLRECQRTFPNWTKSGVGQLWHFLNTIKPGDIIVANRGQREVLGIGRVVGGYTYAQGQKLAHRLKVDWYDTQPRSVNYYWVKTLIELKPDQFDAIESGEAAEDVTASAQTASDPNAPLFGERAFELLDLLHATPRAATWEANRDDFQTHIEQPMRDLLAQVARKLPADMGDFLETEKRLTSRFVKNDHGQGGAWEHYWGAFYPKGGKRTEASQLFIGIYHAQLEYGFALGAYASDAIERVVARLRRGGPDVEAALKPLRDNPALNNGGRNGVHQPWSNAAELAAHIQNGLRVNIPRDSACTMNRGQLKNAISEQFVELFPLMRLVSTSQSADVATGADMLTDSAQISEIESIAWDPYTVNDCARETYMAPDTLTDWLDAIARKKQAVIYGPPGTGKTFVAKRLAKRITNGNEDRIDLVQFHPAYSYEEFIQGIRPESVDGVLSYPIKPGRFLAFCKAMAASDEPAVLIIDEINRANLARVFGELMYALEYRDEAVTLASGERFKIPKNVYVIGTMNTADRSIALVDHALRRRFAFIAQSPDYEILREYHRDASEASGVARAVNIDGLIGVLERVNEAINDPNVAIGVSFFMLRDLDVQLPHIWRMEIMPYLEELFFDRTDMLKEFCWDSISDSVLNPRDVSDG